MDDISNKVEANTGAQELLSPSPAHGILIPIPSVMSARCNSEIIQTERGTILATQGKSHTFQREAFHENV